MLDAVQKGHPLLEFGVRTPAVLHGPGAVRTVPREPEPGPNRLFRRAFRGTHRSLLEGSDPCTNQPVPR